MQGSEDNDGNDKNLPSAGAAFVPVSQQYLDVQIQNDFADLEAKKKAFALEFINNGYKHRDASVSVGKSAATGSKWINDPIIKAYINHLQNQRVQESIITTALYEARLLELNDMAMGYIPVAIVNKEGGEYTACVFNGTLALNTLQELGKVNKIVETETKGGGTVNVNIDVNALLGDSPVTEGITIEMEPDK